MPAANRSPDAPLTGPTIASKTEKKKRKVKRGHGPRTGAYLLEVDHCFDRFHHHGRRYTRDFGRRQQS